MNIKISATIDFGNSEQKVHFLKYHLKYVQKR